MVVEVTFTFYLGFENTGKLIIIPSCEICCCMPSMLSQMSWKNHWIPQPTSLYSNCFEGKELLYGINWWSYSNFIESSEIQCCFRCWINHDVCYRAFDSCWSHSSILHSHHFQTIHQKQHHGTNFHVDCCSPGINYHRKSVHVSLFCFDGHDFGLFHFRLN